MDLLILVLLVGGAGFGGYYWGTQQKMAPVNAVPAGTPGALPASAPTVAASPGQKLAPSALPVNTHDSPAPANSSDPAPSEEKEKTVAAAKNAAKKFWISSSGSDYIGCSITVSVNGTAVDSFFGPGKTVDITRLVKPGENTIDFDAKALGDQYNKHKGDAKAVLTLQVVSGPFIQENFKKSDVIKAFKRNAAETEDVKSSEEFIKD